MTNLRDLARRFHALHTPGRPLLLPNAWDTASARIIEDAGAAAIATTSAGVAWDLGTADGDRLEGAAALAQVARIASAVGVPVTADIEGGYAADADGVAATVRAVLDAGAVGVNIEDGLRPADEHVRRITAARAAADAAEVPLFVNARIDVYLAGIGTEADRLDETLRRAADCVAAGADGIFVPGVVDPGTVEALAKGIDAPLNVMAGPGAPDAAELGRRGAARVSVGSGIAQAAHAVVRRAAAELLETGTYTALTDGEDYGRLNALMGERRSDR
ncbi:isocitrate lyase/phosphoenolpyruvate mutase family protein [Streptomyces sp. PKU-EA00015]|uniref:isocitrate lyase/PEP mutase family protein n=1 Tax=Streptomyces sp. PKU-EA00015 TaxID=2748326 RepID=UPI0015A233C9|nr:isocitrate lyase/phosphoenolpyruvate mutase family protein [Streptomyces sp. PKU-EA00015]NWF24955.1 isocitrate lyase/phosphoenolpyruvate mutase family protein [Streptomyces sp. PKU-EA00015]